MPDSHHDERSAPRFRYRCNATLSAADTSCPAHLLNISQSGALVAILEENRFAMDDRVELTIEQDGGEDITLLGSIAHVKKHYIGLKCDPVSDEDREQLALALDFLAAEHR